MATNVEQLIIAIKAVGTDVAERELKKIKKAAKETEDAAKGSETGFKRFFGAFKGFRGSTSALTNTTGQLSVQLQDIAVQAQSGTDGIRILAQQGPQIASIFGPTGAVFGAIIAFSALIAGPFIKSLFDAGESIEDLIKKANDLGINLQKDFPLVFAEKLKELQDQESDLIKETADLTKAIAEEEAVIADLQNRMDQGLVTQEFFTNSTRSNREEIVELNKELQEEQLSLKGVQDSLESLLGFQSDEDKLLVEMRENLDKLVEKLKEEVATYGMGELALIAYNAEKFKKLGLDTEELEALQRKQQLQKNEEDREKRLAKNRAERQKLEENARKKNEKEEEREANERQKRKKAEDKKAQDILRRNNETQFQIIVEAREKRIEEEEKEAERKAEQEENFAKFMAERRKNEFERIQEAANERRRKEKEEQEIADQEAILARENVTNALLGFEGKLLKGKTEKQKAAFRLGVNLLNEEKRQNASKIISDSFAAAMAAQKSLSAIPFIGPVLGFAAAATIIAAGASYATQSLAGRALGGQVRGGESYVVGERGPEVLTMGSNGRIIPNDKLSAPSQTNNQNVSVSFNITATDASGFDQLLQARRGMIIGMINQAMNNRGRKALV